MSVVHSVVRTSPVMHRARGTGFQVQRSCDTVGSFLAGNIAQYRTALPCAAASDAEIVNDQTFGLRCLEQPLIGAQKGEWRQITCDKRLICQQRGIELNRIVGSQRMALKHLAGTVNQSRADRNQLILSCAQAAEIIPELLGIGWWEHSLAHAPLECANHFDFADLHRDDGVAHLWGDAGEELCAARLGNMALHQHAAVSVEIHDY
jgi:hypothetical protein